MLLLLETEFRKLKGQMNISFPEPYFWSQTWPCLSSIRSAETEWPGVITSGWKLITSWYPRFLIAPNIIILLALVGTSGPCLNLWLQDTPEWPDDPGAVRGHPLLKKNYWSHMSSFLSLNDLPLQALQGLEAYPWGRCTEGFLYLGDDRKHEKRHRCQSNCHVEIKGKASIVVDPDAWMGSTLAHFFKNQRIILG